MSVLLIILGILFILAGVAGCILPVLPGPLLAWLALLLTKWIPGAEINDQVIWTAFAVALVVHALDYIIPAMGTKKFGGSKWGIWGATIGLLVGIFTPIPMGVVLGPFLGAFIGEMIHESQADRALKAALGSLVGFLFSTGLNLAVTLYFAYLFVQAVW